MICFQTVQSEEYNDIHPIGTAAVVVQVTGTNWPQPAYTLLVTGLCRFKLEKLLQETPFPVAQVVQLDKLPGQRAGESNTLHNQSQVNWDKSYVSFLETLDLN